MIIKGIYESGQVFMDGQELLPDESLKIANHSPTGFAWGYGGSGPAQLALAILMTRWPAAKALKHYQDFKWKKIATLPASDFEIEVDPDEWLSLENEGGK